MAKIGLNSFRYAVATVSASGLVTYGGAKTPAKAISFQFDPTVSDAKLYADDALAESDSRVTGGTVTMGIDKEDYTTMADLLGHTKDAGGEIIDNVNDVAPYVGVGRVTRIMENGTQKFRATVLSLVKFSEPSEDENTMGETVEFGTYELNGTMTIPVNGKWRHRKVFSDQASAISYIEGLLGSSVTL